MVSIGQSLRPSSRAGAVLLAAAAAFCLCMTAPRARAQSPAEGRTVLFYSDVPEVVIFLQEMKNGQPGTSRRIGTTGGAGEAGGFHIDLPPGDYRVLWQKQGYTQGARLIKVSDRPSQPPIFISVMKPAPTPTPEPTPTPVEAAPTPTPSPTPETKSALERFLDPKLSDQLKPDDWKQFLSSTYDKLSRDSNDPRLTAQAQFARGQLQYLAGDYATALATFNAMPPDLPKTAPEQALARYGMGVTNLAVKRYAQAETECNAVTELNPELWLGYRCLADALDALKRKKDAEVARGRASRLGYEPLGPSLASLRNLVEDGKHRDALQGLQALAAKEPSGEVYALLGEAYAETGKGNNAYKAYSDAVAAYLKGGAEGLDATAARAFYKLGEIELREENTEKGLRLIECAQSLDAEAKFIDRGEANKKVKSAYDKLRKLPGGATQLGKPCAVLPELLRLP